MKKANKYPSNYQVQSLDIEVEDDAFKGTPFVIKSDGNWIKNNDSNFYIEFGEKKQIKDLMDQAKNAGQPGLAGILMWMRFMATRQLIWNKNYNMKPR
ncbi:hypothetical protein PIB30_042435 [Stylosanthes scabra]|uniref:Alpha-glucan water dikinase-like N-terminal Ig-like domain-containing protein n=1 Tax=Stylosanthes scabra TaxID=79078 RepID=A0ABU6SFF0_9FABA|nr:hypothetical protein [Stylosanthes scabra]